MATNPISSYLCAYLFVKLGDLNLALDVNISFPSGANHGPSRMGEDYGVTRAGGGGEQRRHYSSRLLISESQECIQSATLRISFMKPSNGIHEELCPEIDGTWCAVMKAVQSVVTGNKRMRVSPEFGSRKNVEDHSRPLIKTRDCILVDVLKLHPLEAVGLLIACLHLVAVKWR